MNKTSADELMQLIIQARHGCNDSLGELFELYRSYLGLVAQLQLGEGMRAKSSPSDLVQNTFLQAKRCFSQFAGQSEGELIAWLRAILVSQLLTRARESRTQRRDIDLERTIHGDAEQSSAILAGLLAGREMSPSQSVMRRERAVLLADALDKLPEEYREVIVSRNLHGKTFGEVAEKMNRSVHSVRGLWRRALGRLRQLIGENVL